MPCRGRDYPGAPMAELALGAVAAVAASALFSAGLLLQALEARRLPPGAGGAADAVVALLRRPRWLLGGGAMVVGFGFHVSALLFAPIAVVQPSLAAGLLVLLVHAARVDGAPVGARELGGVAAIGAGVVVLTLLSPERTTVTGGPLALILGLGGLGLVALAPQAVRVRGPARAGMLAMVGAGAAYSLTGLTTKLFSDRLDAGDWGATVAWLAATALAAGLALLDQTMALQRRRATQVGVVIYVLPVVVPVLLAPVLFGEDFGASAGGWAPLALTGAVVAAGAGVLASSPGVTAAEHPTAS